MRRFLVAAVLALSTPLVHAEAPRLGTEAEPELVDAAHDESYAGAFAGPQDRSEVDILANWVEFLATEDAYLFALKTNSFEGLPGRGAAGDDWDCECRMKTFAGAETLGDLFLWIRWSPTEKSFVVNASFTREGMVEPIEVPVRNVDATLATPGIVRVGIDRETVQRLGEELRDFNVHTRQARDLGLGFNQYAVTDDGFSERPFLLEHAAVVDEQESEAESSLPPSTAADGESGKRIASLGFVVSAGILLAATAIRRRSP